MKLTSRVIPSSAEFKENETANLAALEQVAEAARSAALGGGATSRER